MKSRKTYFMTLSAIFAALIFLFTYLFRIPTPFGYTHLGNMLVFLVGTLLPAPYAWSAVAIGCGLADLMAAPAWIIPTVLVKGTTVLMMSSKTEKIICTRNMIGLVLAYLVNFFGYYICEGLMFGNWLMPLTRVFSALVAPLLCALVFILIGKLMDQTAMKEKFHLCYE